MSIKIGVIHTGKVGMNNSTPMIHMDQEGENMVVGDNLLIQSGTNYYNHRVNWCTLEGNFVAEANHLQTVDVGLPCRGIEPGDIVYKVN